MFILPTPLYLWFHPYVRYWCLFYHWNLPSNSQCPLLCGLLSPWSCWWSICCLPLRFLSGHSTINYQHLAPFGVGYSCQAVRWYCCHSNPGHCCFLSKHHVYRLNVWCIPIFMTWLNEEISSCTVYVHLASYCPSTASLYRLISAETCTVFLASYKILTFLGPVSWRSTTVKWRQFSQSNRHSTIGARQTEYHDALPSSVNVQSHLTSSLKDDDNASWYWICRVPIVEWRLTVKTVVTWRLSASMIPAPGSKLGGCPWQKKCLRLCSFYLASTATLDT